jgi:hypothetical protein
MGNMSYCRFENTARDLADCVKAINNREIYELSSDYEVDGLRNLLRLAKDVVDNESYIKNALNEYE